MCTDEVYPGPSEPRRLWMSLFLVHLCGRYSLPLRYCHGELHVAGDWEWPLVAIGLAADDRRRALSVVSSRYWRRHAWDRNGGYELQVEVLDGRKADADDCVALAGVHLELRFQGLTLLEVSGDGRSDSPGAGHRLLLCKRSKKDRHRLGRIGIKGCG